MSTEHCPNSINWNTRSRKSVGAIQFDIPIYSNERLEWNILFRFSHFFRFNSIDRMCAQFRPQSHSFRGEAVNRLENCDAYETHEVQWHFTLIDDIARTLLCQRVSASETTSPSPNSHSYLFTRTLETPMHRNTHKNREQNQWKRDNQFNLVAAWSNGPRWDRGDNDRIFRDMRSIRANFFVFISAASLRWAPQETKAQKLKLWLNGSTHRWTNFIELLRCSRQYSRLNIAIKKYIIFCHRSEVVHIAQDAVVTRCVVGPVREEDEINHKKKKNRKNRRKSEQSERVLWYASTGNERMRNAQQKVGSSMVEFVHLVERCAVCLVTFLYHLRCHE